MSEGHGADAPRPPRPVPDARSILASEFPFRAMPPVSNLREGRYQVVFRQTVLDQIHAHGKSSMSAEVCGMLVGDVYSDSMGPWLYIEHCIAGDAAVGQQTQVTITSETWTRMHETLDRDFPGKKIVGWYHTHPGFGIFLSGMDTFIQDNFFNQNWNVASVYDPHSGDEGVFLWRDGQSIREPFLIEQEPGTTPAAPGLTPGPIPFTKPLSFEQHHHAVDVPDRAPASLSPSSAVAASNASPATAPGSASAEVVELRQRLRSVEWKVDVILTGLAIVLLIGLVAPLCLFVLKPDWLTHMMSPAAPTPTAAPGAGDAPTGPLPAAGLPAPAPTPSRLAPSGTGVSPILSLPAAPSPPLPAPRASPGASLQSAAPARAMPPTVIRPSASPPTESGPAVITVEPPPVDVGTVHLEPAEHDHDANNARTQRSH